MALCRRFSSPSTFPASRPHRGDDARYPPQPWDRAAEEGLGHGRAARTLRLSNAVRDPPLNYLGRPRSREKRRGLRPPRRCSSYFHSAPLRVKSSWKSRFYRHFHCLEQHFVKLV